MYNKLTVDPTHVCKHILVLFFNGNYFLLAQNKFANFLPACVYRPKRIKDSRPTAKTKKIASFFNLGRHLTGRHLLKKLCVAHNY